MSKFTEKIGNAFRQFPMRLWQTVQRFWGTILILLGYYLFLDYVSYAQISPDNQWFWLPPLGAIAILSAELFFESRPQKWWVNLLVKLGLLALLGLTSTSMMTYELRPALILTAVVALFCLVVCKVYASRIEETLGVLIVRGATAVLFALVLLAGASLILAGTDLLLFSVNYRAYEEVIRFCFVLFAPLMFLYGIPHPQDETSLLRGYQQLLKVVVLPLLGVFMAVLYCYYIKLAFTARLPISELGGVSLIFLCINLPMTLLAKPFCEGWVAKLRNILLYGTFPVFAALFFTAGRQVLIYGVSVTRYIVLVGGLALLLCVLVMLYRKGKHLPAVFVVLLVTALLASYGPQSCYGLTRISQHDRLTTALTKAELLKDGVLTPKEDADEALQREILDLVDYCLREGLTLPDCFPKDSYHNLKGVLGFDHSTLPETQTESNWYNNPYDQPVDLGDGRYLIRNGYEYTIDTQWGVLEIDAYDPFVIRCDGEPLFVITADELCEAVLPQVQAEDTTGSYTYRFGTDLLQGHILLDYLSEPELYCDWTYAYIFIDRDKVF